MIFYPFICTYSLEDPGNSDPEESRDDPNTFQESYDDINVDHLLNNFQLVGTDTKWQKNILTFKRCPYFQGLKLKFVSTKYVQIQDTHNVHIY